MNSKNHEPFQPFHLSIAWFLFALYGWATGADKVDFTKDQDVHVEYYVSMLDLVSDRIKMEKMFPVVRLDFFYSFDWSYLVGS